MPQALQGDLQTLPQRMFDFCLILGRRVHRPILLFDLLWVALSLLLTLPALHLWCLQLQQQLSQGHSQQGCRPKQQLLLLQMRLNRMDEDDQARSCRRLLFLRLQWVPHPCCQPSRQGNTACPSCAMGTICVLDVAQLDQTQLAQLKLWWFEALIKTK